ncbi:MAG TPA: efflux RND transporter periplasmic adaptor subunit [Myxococcaceae bacterium]|nr:efflux RND transporter periplasmic adaptor subunit [Myxococcaceae bacterium]
MPGEQLPKPLRVQAEPAQLAGADGTAWVAGTLLAAQRAVLSTRLAARVRAVRTDEGARVRRGELLIRLDNDEVVAQLRGTETALSTAMIHERRIATLVSNGAATQSQLDAAQAERALAEAQAAASRASVAYTEIRAPFDGVVQSKRVQPGDLVTPGQPLLELVGGGLEIAVSVSEEEARGIQHGDRLTFDAADRRGKAEVIAIAPGGDVASHRSLLRARLLEPAGLRPGSFARLRIPQTANVQRNVQVPRSSLVQRGDLTGVFIVQGDRAELRWLSLAAAESDLVSVRAGLHAGELVVDAPGNLRDGQLVEVDSAR